MVLPLCVVAPSVTHVSAFFMGVGGTNVERVKSALVNALADID